jgi:hypothetical protein
MKKWLYEIPKADRKKLREALIEEGYDLDEVALHSRELQKAMDRGASDDEIARIQERIIKTGSLKRDDDPKEERLRFFGVSDADQRRIAAFDSGNEDAMIQFVKANREAAYVTLYEKNAQKDGSSEKAKYSRLLIWERDVDSIEELERYQPATNQSNATKSVEEDPKEESTKKSMTLEEFLEAATVLVVDDAATFDINQWEAELEQTIAEELNEDPTQKGD